MADPDAYLPKWPGLIVEGDPVTREQAAEILIRTNSWHGHTNDRDWRRQVIEVCGLTADPEYGWPTYESVAAFEDQYRVLPLTYLRNARIMSSWIGGPHGWCAWDGTIGCNTYNIGKWPTVAEVEDDWRAVAAAFPYLRLRAQLLDGENCEPHTRPVVEFQVGDGQVTVEVEPAGQLRQLASPQMTFLLAVERERGCTLDTLRWALDVTLKAVR